MFFLGAIILHAFIFWCGSCTLGGSPIGILGNVLTMMNFQFASWIYRQERQLGRNV